MIQQLVTSRSIKQQPILASDFDPLPPIEPEMVRQDILQLQEERRIEGLSPIELLTQANYQAHGILPSPLRCEYTICLCILITLGVGLLMQELKVTGNIFLGIK